MTTRPHVHYRWQLAGLSLAMLLPSLGTSIANTALPTLTAAFGASFQDIQWVVLAYLLAMTTLVVSAGRLGDLLGRQRLLQGGILIFTVASALCAIAPALWMLIAARAAQGVGAAIMMSLTTALASEVVPRDKVGGAMGLLGTMSAVGTALGPSLGGVLIAGFGWHAIFAALVPLGAATFVVFASTMRAGKTEARRPAEPFDALGTLLLAASLGAYALAMTVGRGTFGPVNAGLLAAAFAGFGMFLVSQVKGRSPLIRPDALQDATLRSGLIATSLVSTVMMTTLVVGPFYLSAILPLSPATVGLVMSVGPVLAALTGVPAGRLVDRFGTRPLLLAGLAGVIAGCLGVAATAGFRDIIGYVIAVGLMTTGYAVFQAANNAAIMAGVAADRRGVTAGLLGLGRNLGLITGASAMGALFSAVSSGDHVSLAAVTAATTATFLAAAGLAAVAVAFSLRRQPRTVA